MEKARALGLLAPSSRNPAALAAVAAGGLISRRRIS
jgi:hypothetical protein